jgi:branched-chain amino acid transport system permease protein
MSESEVLLQQLITGLSNGMIIALIALGYTMVYGILELINFAHGDLFMLGCFCTLTLVGVTGIEPGGSWSSYGFLFLLLFTLVPLFCGGLNWCIDRFAYRPLRGGPKLAPLVSAIGTSFILLNLGLFWGGLPMAVFDGGQAAAAPKDFPAFVSGDNLLGDSFILFTPRDLMVHVVTIPILIALTLIVKRTRLGKAMRAVAQNPSAAELMGIPVNKIIGSAFLLGGALAGVASVIYALYNNTIFFQMGYRVGMDAFTAAILGGIGSLPGAFIGGICIGLLRALSDQYIGTSWTNVSVFGILIGVLIFRPGGLFGVSVKEKV